MEQEIVKKKSTLTRLGWWLWRRAAIAALALSILGLYGVIALNLKIFNPISKAFADYSITDFYYDLAGYNQGNKKDTSNIVTIVDMTELPNRRALAMALEEIAACKPKTIGVDVVFEGLKEYDELGDSMIWSVAHAQPKTVFSYKLITDSFDGHEYHQTVRSFFADSLITQGYTNMPRNIYGGMKRQLSVGCYVEGELVPSLIKRVADDYAEEETVPLADKDVRINFKPKDYAVVPPDSIMEYRNLIEDRIVLFGAMTEEADMHYTPLGKIAGVKLLAFAIETLIKHNEVREVPQWLMWLLSFLVLLFSVAVFDAYDRFVARRSPVARVFFGAILVKNIVKFMWMALFMWLSYLLFSLFDISLNLAWALAAIAFTVSATNLYDLLAKYFNEKKQPKAESYANEK